MFYYYPEKCAMLNLSRRLLFLLAAWAFLGAGCADLGGILTTPEAQVTLLAPVFASPQVIRFRAEVRIRNPNPLTLSWRACDYTLSLNGRLVHSGTARNLPPALSRSEGALEIAFGVDAAKLPAGEAGSNSLTAVFQGRLTPASSWLASPLMFSYAGEVFSARVPTVEFLGVRRAGRQPAAAFRMTNPNRLPLRFVRADIRLSAGAQANHPLLSADAHEIPAGEAWEWLLPLTPGPGAKDPAAKLDFNLEGELEYEISRERIIVPVQTRGRIEAAQLTPDAL
jgi:hypothetical protein